MIDGRCPRVSAHGKTGAVGRHDVGSIPTGILANSLRKALHTLRMLAHIARMKPLYFVWNVEHRKQSATRPCRMPALVGVLLCAARLLVIPRKALSQRQGISRP